MELEARLEREMTELGPLVQRRKQAEAEGVNPEYATALRARLMTMLPAEDAAETESAAPMPRGTRSRVRTGWVVSTVAVAAALIAVLITHHPTAPRHPIAITTPGPTSAPIIAMAVPTPNAQDLLRAYPPGAGGGGMMSPEQSLFDILGVPYGGHLRIVGLAPPPQARNASTFRLASPISIAGRVSRLRQQLGIRSTQKRVTNPLDHSHWLIAADGGVPSIAPLHSIAVSLQTGELIYHDSPDATRQLRRGRPLNASRAGALSRRWLAGLGWPAAHMPVQSTVPRPQMFPPSVGTAWEVRLGWAGTGPDAVAAATLLVMPGGRIVEARVWPPVARRGAVRTQNVAGPWQAIRDGRVRIAVEGMTDQQPVNGIAMLRRVDVVQVLVTSVGRGAYLVPVYRFAGTAQLRGVAGTRVWYALVSAPRR